MAASGINYPWKQPPTVAIAGGGLAGLAAACALADAGFRVTLFERRPYLGGRASSYEHPGTGEIVDNCQHVMLGCCTNLLDFYARTGVCDRIRWFDRLTFLEPGGRQSVIQPSSLPPPLHTAPSFLRAPCLDIIDKLSIARAMAELAPMPRREKGENFLHWLRRHSQTERAIGRFWKTILVSALNEDLDRVSVPYAAQVVRESFLKSAEAGRMGVPTVPLSELYASAGDYIRARGGQVLLRASVDRFQADAGAVHLQVAGTDVCADFAVLAVPFDAMSRLLPNTTAALRLRDSVEHLQPSPITGIHLWFDRQVTELEHAVLLDRTIQWMFHKSKLLHRNGNGSRSPAGSYLELVVSSSKSLVEKSRQEIVELAVTELAEFLPQVRSAQLLKSTVIKEVYATYSPGPGTDQYRPQPVTPWARVFLAGDWIATGWPATMEGAVRSGYKAAEMIAHVAGLKDASFLAPDLPPGGFMRLFR